MREEGSTSLFCWQISSCPRTICWKKILPSIELPCHLFKNQLTIDTKIYLWTPSSLSLTTVSVLKSDPHCLDYCIFVIGFEIRNCESSKFVLFRDFFLMMLLAILGPWHFYINYRISFHSCRKGSYDFVRDCVESVDQFWGYCHLSNFKTSNPWTWLVFPFI